MDYISLDALPTDVLFLIATFIEDVCERFTFLFCTCKNIRYGVERDADRGWFDTYGVKLSLDDVRFAKYWEVRRKRGWPLASFYDISLQHARRGYGRIEGMLDGIDVGDTNLNGDIRICLRFPATKADLTSIEHSQLSDNVTALQLLGGFDQTGHPGILDLTPLRHLEKLEICDTSMSSAILTDRSLPPSLTCLDLRDTFVAMHGMHRSHQKLHTLRLERCHFIDGIFQQWEDSLECLDVIDCFQSTREMIAFTFVQPVPRLKRVRLAWTCFHSCLLQLHHVCSSLEELDLRGCGREGHIAVQVPSPTSFLSYSPSVSHAAVDPHAAAAAAAVDPHAAAAAAAVDPHAAAAAAAVDPHAAAAAAAVDPFAMRLFPRLHTVRLSGNHRSLYMSLVDSSFFMSCQNLRVLDVDDVLFTLISQPLEFQFPYLHTLLVRASSASGCSDIPEWFFACLPSLRQFHVQVSEGEREHACVRTMDTITLPLTLVNTMIRVQRAHPDADIRII